MTKELALLRQVLLSRIEVFVSAALTVIDSPSSQNLMRALTL